MKGLIIKDLMCMKKQIALFSYVTVSVIVLSIMFLLSARYGNIHTGMQITIEQNQVDECDVVNMYTKSMMLFMILPAACICDPTAILREDNKAGFADFAAALPVPVNKRILAKYISSFCLFVINGIFIVILSFVLSKLTDMITFGDFINMELFLTGILVILAALTIMLNIVMGKGKEIFASIIASFVITASLAIPLVRAAINDYQSILRFPREQGYLVILVAVGIVVVSYFVSVFTAQKKRGVV